MNNKIEYTYTNSEEKASIEETLVLLDEYFAEGFGCEKE